MHDESGSRSSLDLTAPTLVVAASSCLSWAERRVAEIMTAQGIESEPSAVEQAVAEKAVEMAVRLHNAATRKIQGAQDDR